MTLLQCNLCSPIIRNIKTQSINCFLIKYFYDTVLCSTRDWGRRGRQGKQLVCKLAYHLFLFLLDLVSMAFFVVAIYSCCFFGGGGAVY